MELIKLVDHEGTPQYLNKDYIISIRPFYGFSTEGDNRRSKVEYGSGFIDCIYMKESASEVAIMVRRKDNEAN